MVLASKDIEEEVEVEQDEDWVDLSPESNGAMDVSISRNKRSISFADSMLIQCYVRRILKCKPRGEYSSILSSTNYYGCRVAVADVGAKAKNQ